MRDFLVYDVLFKRSAEFEAYVRNSIERFPAVYHEIEKDVKQKADDAIAAVQDQTPIPVYLNFHRFFMTFSWGTIMLAAYYIMYLQGSTTLPLLLDFIIDKSSAVLMAYVVVPAFLYVRLSKYKEYSRKSRFILLAGAIFQGLLVGFLLSNCSMVIYAPIEVINMLYVSVASRVLGHKLQNDRQAYFGIINGIGFIFIILIGIITRQLSKAYLFATVSTVLTSHAVIQVYMRRVAQSDLRPSNVLLLMMTLSIYSQTLIRILFGTYIPKKLARRGINSL